jgi:hypothetical protein
MGIFRSVPKMPRKFSTFKGGDHDAPSIVTAATRRTGTNPRTTTANT